MLPGLGGGEETVAGRGANAVDLVGRDADATHQQSAVGATGGDPGHGFGEIGIVDAVLRERAMVFDLMALLLEEAREMPFQLETRVIGEGPTLTRCHPIRKCRFSSDFRGFVRGLKEPRDDWA